MKYLADSDFLVGIFREGDPHHETAVKKLEEVKLKKDSLYVLNLVLQETATVLSNRTGMDAVRLFYDNYLKLELVIIELDSLIEKRTWDILLRQTKKGTSFIDCANLAALDLYKLDKILSFDQFYPKNLRIY